LIRKKAERRTEMRYYETLYLINPNLADEDYRDVVAKFNNIIEKNKGVVAKVDEWGNKTLAYQVKKFDKGYYVLLQYCGAPGITAELHRELKLDDRVFKYQTVKLSDKVDPESLRPQADNAEERASEEAEPVVASNSEKEDGTENNQEGENDA
jgi:small subunit ribosomal protein S6